MNHCSFFVLLAEYNQWMNDKVYDTAARLGPEALAQDRGAFFGSIMGTLNHLVVADTIWLNRFCTLPGRAALLDEVLEWPKALALDERLFTDLDSMRGHRRRMDDLIRRWVATLTESDLDRVLAYRNTKGVPARRRLSGLLQHLFNHQTHHRGQVTTLLTQAGQDVGVTDLFALLPSEEEV
jgi:uncharacterized damage-inducible protein DinB